MSGCPHCLQGIDPVIEQMRQYLAEYATAQERLATKLETPDDIWAGLINANTAYEIRKFLEETK